MSKVAVMAKIPAQPGKRAELVAAFQQGLDNAAAEPGTLLYVLHEDAKDPDLLWVYELYEDQAAFDAHATSEGMKALGTALRPLAAGRPELTFLTPTGGKGI